MLTKFLADYFRTQEVLNVTYFQFQFPLLSPFIAWMTELQLTNFWFFDSKILLLICVKGELLNIQLIRTNNEPKQSPDHAPVYSTRAGEHKEQSLSVTNKQIHSLANKQTQKH